VIQTEKEVNLQRKNASFHQNVNLFEILLETPPETLPETPPEILLEIPRGIQLVALLVTEPANQTEKPLEIQIETSTETTPETLTENATSVHLQFSTKTKGTNEVNEADHQLQTDQTRGDPHRRPSHEETQESRTVQNLDQNLL